MIDCEESLEQNPFDRRLFERRPGRRLISELDAVMEEIVRKRMKRIEERPVLLERRIVPLRSND